MDPYVYPGTTVHRNLRDIRDPGQFDQFDAVATTRRIVELEHEPVRGLFDARHLRAIHRHIFQDVYEWAGDFRTVDISKSGDPFALHQHIASALDGTCEELNREGCLAGSELEAFSIRSAYCLGELNAIHPFPEGNGRTQREFVRGLCLQSGLTIDWSRVSQEEMIDASRRSLYIDNSGLEQILRKALGHEPALDPGGY